MPRLRQRQRSVFRNPPEACWRRIAVAQVGWTRTEKTRNEGPEAGNVYSVYSHPEYGPARSAEQAYSRTPAAARPALPSWLDVVDVVVSEAAESGAVGVHALEDEGDSRGRGSGSGGAGGAGAGGDDDDDDDDSRPMDVLAMVAEEAEGASTEAIEATQLPASRAMPVQNVEVMAMEVDPASSRAESAR